MTQKELLSTGAEAYSTVRSISSLTVAYVNQSTVPVAGEGHHYVSLIFMKTVYPSRRKNREVAARRNENGAKFGRNRTTEILYWVNELDGK